MTTMTGAPVVVGVDGSARALAATETAAAEAALRHRPLRIVHAFVWPTVGSAIPPGDFGPSLPAFRERADEIVAEAVRVAGKCSPGIAVTSEVTTGAPVPVLLAESRRAHLMVLGDRGVGGFAGLFLGSVAMQLATHGECPTLVVRGEQPSAGPVVVGVDGSAVSAHACTFAAEEASLRGVGLVALHVWRAPVIGTPGGTMPLVYDVDLLEEEERRVLAESTAGLAERYPDVPIRQEIIRGAPGHELAQRSRSAQLMVVGSRGHGGFTGLLLGSVSQHLIGHAGCPVVVARPQDPPG
ncbi:universal stress protein [Actinoplanes sp. NPDC049599]|uniref:universal stress protein n=1 Tax=Actinoplanes sp. NPDC049599 TaxID=3363903 RepID=UPI0037887556